MLEPIRTSGHTLQLLNQLLLPETERWEDIDSLEHCATAIRDMIVRGAPAIGVTAAYGFALAFRESRLTDEGIGTTSNLLLGTRPTAVNLHFAVKRMQAYAMSLIEARSDNVFTKLWQEAKTFHEEDREQNRRIGEFGASWFAGNNKLRLLTHCNAGSLATGGYGTALGVIYSLAKQGRLEKVWVDETRPYLQGARLTAYELQTAGIPYQVICDNMAGSLMASGQIDAVITGADRIAKNGDTANKIGTYSLAVLCKYHQIPFIIAAPHTTLDPECVSGQSIPIEFRPQQELGIVANRQIVPEISVCYNPSFDVTPANLITAVVTNNGVFKCPYDFSESQLPK